MSDDGFWTFSVAIYDRPGVAASCLALQDEYGADVTLVLFALWCATRGCRLEPAELARAAAVVAPWRDGVVRAIRQVRRALKPPPGPPFDPAATEALRQTLLSAELAAERLQQEAMATVAPPPGALPAATAAEANLACLARQASIPAAAMPLRTLIGALG